MIIVILFITSVKKILKSLIYIYIKFIISIIIVFDKYKFESQLDCIRDICWDVG
jgi:hypothetical protein